MHTLLKIPIEKCCDTCNTPIESCLLEIDRRNLNIDNHDFMQRRAYYHQYGCENYKKEAIRPVCRVS